MPKDKVANCTICGRPLHEKYCEVYSCDCGEVVCKACWCGSHCINCDDDRHENDEEGEG